MSTGIQDWVNFSEIGAIYPFQGIEVPLVIAAVVFWLWWHVRAIRDEDREMQEAAAYYRRIGLEKVIQPDGKARRVQPENTAKHTENIAEAAASALKESALN